MNAARTRYIQSVCYAFILCCWGSLNVCTLSAQQLQPSKMEEVPQRILITSAEDTRWLSTELKAPKINDGIINLDAAEVNAFESLLTKTLQAKNSGDASVTDLEQQWAELHWHIGISPSKTFFSIREIANHRHGRGVYAFRVDAENPIAIQAPHRFNDLMTGTISTKLFTENSISAIALNTMYRKEIDLSHTKIHYINAFTSAIIKAQHNVAILQLHGFTNEGKKGAAKFAQTIISDTTKFPGRSARQTALEFKTIFGQDHTRLFPIDIQQLGGTTNRQAITAHNLGCPDFLHIELNYEFRSRLKRDASVRDSFFAGIIGGIAK